jgi:hypothetical protein
MDGCNSKGEKQSMQKSMIRVVLVAVLLMAGNAVQAHAASVPNPVPALPPVACN